MYNNADQKYFDLFSESQGLEKTIYWNLYQDYQLLFEKSAQCCSKMISSHRVLRDFIEQESQVAAAIIGVPIGIIFAAVIIFVPAAIKGMIDQWDIERSVKAYAYGVDECYKRKFTVSGTRMKSVPDLRKNILKLAADEEKVKTLCNDSSNGIYPGGFSDYPYVEKVEEMCNQKGDFIYCLSELSKLSEE